MIFFLQTINQILTAGIAITAFSLLLYALTFNLRDRVARSFALVMVCVVITYTGGAIGSTASSPVIVDGWLHFEWIGIIFLPVAYLQFSDAILATTGKVSRGRRRWAVRFAYLIGIFFLALLLWGDLVGGVIYDQPPAPRLRPTTTTDIFLACFLIAIVISLINLFRAYQRTTTSTSRRRMLYLILGAVAPALGVFPFLPYSSGFAERHQLLFWSVSFALNVGVGIFIVIMAYVVAFFGVPWPDRVVRVRLFKWIMRGPFTASLTLAFVTLTRRAGDVFGSGYTAIVPIIMVATILLSEYLITIFSTVAQRIFFDGTDRVEVDALRTLENQLLTQNDLKQFLEIILATVSDRLQADGAYIAILKANGLEWLVTTGSTRIESLLPGEEAGIALIERVAAEDAHPAFFRWGGDDVFPLMNGTADAPELLGFLGISGASEMAFDAEQNEAIGVLVRRASMVLHDWRVQQNVMAALQSLSPQMDVIQRLRAAGQYNLGGMLDAEAMLPHETDLANWVKDALTHYWGGPKLTDNPLIQLKVVQDALGENGGNQANALRSILRRAIEHTRPQGERRFTGEWILYNIVDMKFMEGKKVREVALRLAMSEADLYRKQRIAIESVARAIAEMEAQARKGNGSPLI